MNNQKITGIFFLFAIIAMVILLSSFVMAAAPSGATLTPLSNQTAPTNGAENVSAYAGNITEVNIYGKSTTQAWQGYFGNVTGVIQLADSNSKVMYNWSTASPTGEVYASINNTIIWTNVQCFNFTATGALGDESATKGASSLTGLNESELATRFGITAGVDTDGINQTFNKRNHAQFFTNGLQFSVGECPNTKIYNSTGQGIFDEALIWSPDSGAVIFASLLLDNADGFDAKTHDFEMLVLENGHGADTTITPYNFYVELQ